MCDLFRLMLRFSENDRPSFIELGKLLIEIPNEKHDENIDQTNIKDQRKKYKINHPAVLEALKK